MWPSRGEKEKAFQEPLVLGVEINHESAARYEDFASGRSYDEVYAVWGDPQVVNPTIRQRALAALTRPLNVVLPFASPEQSIARLLCIKEEVDGLETASLRSRLKAKPLLAEEMAAGVLYWYENLQVEAADQIPRQSVIRELLPIVSKETANRLFDYFEINDIFPFYTPDSSSGYGPLMKLLSDPEIPGKYKDSALTSWMEIAEHEQEGSARPRQEYERAIWAMANFISDSVYDRDVDDQTITTLVAFLEDHYPQGRTYIRSLKTKT
jgi:hypothetical protein